MTKQKITEKLQARVNKACSIKEIRRINQIAKALDITLNLSDGSKWTTQPIKTEEVITNEH